MQFCSVCNNLYNVTRNVNRIQNGGSLDFNNIIKSIISGQFNRDEIIHIDLATLTQSLPYKKLAPKRKEFVFNKVQELQASKLQGKSENNLAFYICQNCKYSEQIPDGEILYSKSFLDDTNTNTTNIHIDTNIINDPTLPITTNFTCPNKNCESHKNSNLREAVFYRHIPSSFEIRYICKACLFSWIN